MKAYLLKIKILSCFFYLAFYPVKAQNLLPKPDHVVIVIFENASYEVVMQQKNAKFLCQLAESPHCASFTNSFGLVHPSQPNYIKLFCGQDEGVHDDSLPKKMYFRSPNLGRALIDKGLTFKGFAEDLPYKGYNGEKYHHYVRKHCPWVNWQADTGRYSISGEFNLPYKAFPKDYSTLPTLSFVIPHLEHDMHEPANTFAAIWNGDKWLRRNLGNYIEWAKTHNSLLIVTFDEDDNHNHNHIPTLFVGQMIKQGAYNQPITHYNVLRTLLDMYGLEPFGKAGTAEPIKDCWEFPPALGKKD